MFLLSMMNIMLEESAAFNALQNYTTLKWVSVESSHNRMQLSQIIIITKFCANKCEQVTALRKPISVKQVLDNGTSSYQRGVVWEVAH